MSTAQFQAARAFTSTAPPSEINVVSAADLAVWRQYFGQTLPPATSVPEPGGLALALVGVGAWLRRRRIDSQRESAT